MKNKLIHNLSTNTVQLVANQLLGFGIFYILSIGLDKNSFGQINLVLAMLLAAFNILSFGIDQLVIKKVAAGDNISSVLSLYIVHVLLSGLAFYVMVLAGYLLFPHVNHVYALLLLIGIGKLMIFFSTPFKQAVNGMERFKLLAWMSVISNLVRCFGLIAAAFLQALSIKTIVIIFITGDLAELVCCFFLFRISTGVKIKPVWDKLNYIKLLREAWPQTGVVLITSALARFDWIFIGLFSASRLADYSFAYKIFEISTLPLLAIAPILIPRFTKMIERGNVHVEELKFLVRAEMMLSAFIAMLLTVCWTPVIDWLTAGKYGAVNEQTVFILALCMPLLYLNNFLWTLYFAQGRLKMILSSFIITFSVNVVGDIVLIPLFHNEGAAFAFLAACVAQSVFYLRKNEIVQLDLLWKPLVTCTLCALTGGFIARMLFSWTWLMLPLSVVLYIAALYITGQFKPNDREAARQLLTS